MSTFSGYFLLDKLRSHYICDDYSLCIGCFRDLLQRYIWKISGREHCTPWRNKVGIGHMIIT